MVTQITSFAKNGVSDWLYQRLSAIFLALYFIFLFGFIVKHPDLSFDDWYALFDNSIMKVATITAAFTLLVHTWIGLWTITTDYLTDHLLGSKAIWIRLPIQAIYSISLVLLVAWIAIILWGGQ